MGYKNVAHPGVGFKRGGISFASRIISQRNQYKQNECKFICMKLFNSIIAIAFILSACTTNHYQKHLSNNTGGYILKRNEGYVFPGSDSGLIVKASPEMGSRSDIAIVQKINPGKGTGLHYHEDTDEMFYVIEGTGTAFLGDKPYKIEAGDFIFIPRNVDHKIRKMDSTGILKVIFFMEKPELLKFFKERHKQFFVEKRPLSLEALNALAEKYGTHYKTLN